METRAFVLRAMLLVVLAVPLAGCQAIVEIFNFGFWAGIIFMVLILGLVGFIVSRFRRR
jgi:uncharacterized membrane protein YkvI